MWWKRLIVLVCGVLLSACAVSKEPDIKIISENYETEYCEVSTQRLKINIPDAAQFCEQLNANIEAELKNAVSGFDEAALKSFKNDKFKLSTTQSVKYNKNDFVSVVEEQYIFLGGAHGVSARKTLNVDALLQKEISLGDLFCEEGYREVLVRKIQDIREKNPEEYEDLWQEPMIKDGQDFYITDDNLVIYYQPYELSYYARGFVEFPIRWSEIKGFMKEEYYRIADS